jgi:eukaryotic-like serine/threonine-protein kinase
MDDPVAPGQLLADRFRVVRRIAQGGMGVVYEAFDEKLNRRIALKCARVGHDRHLRPEVRLATEVSHPNICKIYEIHSTDGLDGPLEFFTMELLEGQTLSRRLKEGPLTRHEAETIARDLCAGLAEAHRHQVVHGDLKSANLILTKNPDGSLRAVITDFGLARGASTSGASGGSPGYMAPELYQGATATVASDIYAVGVILHEMVSGFRPDERAAMEETTVTQHASGPAPNADRKQRIADRSQAPLAPLRSRWDKILKTCLQVDPSRRYQSAAQILEALGPSVARRRILIATGALMLAAVAAWATYRQSTAPAQSVKLDIAAVDAPSFAAEANRLRQAALQEIGKLRNSRQIAFSVRSTGWTSQASHRLSTSLTPKGDKLTLRAVLVDLRSGAPVSEWSANYAPDQLRYAPVALAGVVSRAFHLPALTTNATINAAAKPAYDEGLALLQDDSKLDQARAALEAARMADPDSALPYAALAEVQRRQFFLTRVESWNEQAAASLEQAELRNSDCAEVHRIAGLLEYDGNHPDRAIERLRRATEFQPPHADAFLRLGQVYSLGGQSSEALQAYSEAQRLAPRDVRVYQALATLYTTQSNYTEASKALKQAVELAPDRPLFHLLLAANDQDQGRFTEAETELRTALGMKTSAQTFLNLGHVLLYQRRDKDATEALAQAVRLDSKYKFAWLYLGLAYQRSGRIADARTAFQRGLSLAEQDVIQLPRSGYYHAVLSYFCAQTGQTERAVVEAAQALQLAPQHGDTRWMTALAYERTGKREAALKTLEGAPRPLLEDLGRWPEASALTGDERFASLLKSDSGSH